MRASFLETQCRLVKFNNCHVFLNALPSTWMGSDGNRCAVTQHAAAVFPTGIPTVSKPPECLADVPKACTFLYVLVVTMDNGPCYGALQVVILLLLLLFFF